MSTEPRGDQSCEDNGTRQTPAVRYCLRDLNTIDSDEKCEKRCPKRTSTVHTGAIG